MWLFVTVQVVCHLPELVCWKTAASASGNYADEHQESEPK